MLCSPSNKTGASYHLIAILLVAQSIKEHHHLSYYSVMKLQLVISEETGIPFESQVLLISGGETMSPNSRVCSYSAGTVSL